jgi:hypothetical protein
VARPVYLESWSDPKAGKFVEVELSGTRWRQSRTADRVVLVFSEDEVDQLVAAITEDARRN